MGDLGKCCQCGSVKFPHLMRKGPLAAESEEIAAEAVQVAILGHTDSKNRYPKKKALN